MDWRYFAALAVGAAVGLIWRGLVVRYCWNHKTKVTDFIDWVSIKFLLPLHVFFTWIFLRNDQWGTPLLVSMVAGIFMTFFCYFASNRSEEALLRRVITATFGGGNRGVLLLVILTFFYLPGHLELTESVNLFDIFSVMDTAYFLFFTHVLIHHGNRGKPRTKSDSKWYSKLLRILIIFIPLVIMFSGLAAKAIDLAPLIIDALVSIGVEKPRLLISYAVAFLAAISVILKFDYNGLGQIPHLIIRALFIRSVAVILMSVLSFAIFRCGWLGLHELAYLILVYLIFLLVPPSSFAAAYLQEKGADEKARREESIVQVVWNIYYFSIVAVICLIGIPISMLITR